MPRITYKTYRPRDEAMQLIEVIDRIMTEYAEAGYDLTLRQLYYQMIAKDLFPQSWIDAKYNLRHGLSPDTKNTVKNYKKLGDIVSRAREGGHLDWDYLVDRGRVFNKRPHWDGPKDFIDSVAPQFGTDLWAGQKCRVEVWVEKDALIGVLDRACRPWDVPYFACKGYASSSSVWQAAHDRFLMQYAKQKQDVCVIHLSDHDPSGMDMYRDLCERLPLYASSYNSRNGDTPNSPNVTVERIALNMQQVKKYKLPPNPAKENDPRAAKYIEEHGDESWELDGLDPPVLVQLIENAIAEKLDVGKYNKLQKQETAWRKQLVELAGKAKF